MKPDKEFDGTPIVTPTPTVLTDETLRRNPVINRSGMKRLGWNLDKGVFESGAGPAHLTIREKVHRNSRHMAWDNQLIFGRTSENRSSVENADLEAE